MVADVIWGGAAYDVIWERTNTPGQVSGRRAGGPIRTRKGTAHRASGRSSSLNLVASEWAEAKES